jgi:tetratricopeptide (TPR) repeat protein/serine/threonine protein kinase
MPRHDADRNLLFGILALQMDFITRDALIAAMAAWVMEKHRPIGEILVDRGDLDPVDRAALDPMIARHLARHGGDPALSLAALSSIDTAAAALRRSIADPDVLESLASIPAIRSEDSYATRTGPPTEPSSSGIRYTKVRDHAKGGLGVVFVARDRELNREVALKEIQDLHADDPVSRARFLVEAEVTGGLEHPGIVPVYGLGSYADGRPFYAMRFIRGDSLKDAIARFHADDSLRSDPGERALALQKLLRRFLDVCNAIAYAHSRGVLHRDLKPDNVMVGRYGETLVVDWGLAKATGRTDNDAGALMPEATLHPASASGSDQTQPGSVIGTPAYMSPEQAAGRLDLLGPASDVYSLGATLYTLLTGRAPFTDKERIDVLRKVEHGEFPRPREAAPWLDPALEAICLKSMALRSQDRYPSPQTLAEDLERSLADEPVSAYPEPWTRRARRWTRKHRTAVTTTMTTALVAAVLIGSAAWMIRLQGLKTDAATLQSLAIVDQLEGVARATSSLEKWSGAVAEARRAEARIESGGGSVDLRRRTKARLATLESEEARCRAELESDQRDRRMVDALDEARLLPTNNNINLFDISDLLAKQDAYLSAFQAYGIDVAMLSAEESSSRVRTSQIRENLIVALDDWAEGVPKNVPAPRLTAIATAADTSPGRTAIRDAIARKDSVFLRGLLENEDSRRNLGARSRQIFAALIRLGPEANLPVLEAIRRDDPSDFWFNHGLSVAYANFIKPPSWVNAVASNRAAVALRPKSPATRRDLGISLLFKGDHDDAIAEIREAVRLKPDFHDAWLTLAHALGAKRDLDGMIAAAREAIRLKPDFAEAYYYLGETLRLKGDHDASIAAVREAIRIKPDLPHAWLSLGHALKAKRDLDGAIAAYREAIRVKPDFAMAHQDLGVALSAKGDLDGAIAAYREAVRPQPNKAEAYVNLGNDVRSKGDLDGAIAAYREAIRLKTDFSEAYHGLGEGLIAKGDKDAAIAAYREAIRLRRDNPFAHTSLGVALLRKGDKDAAIAAYREAIRLKPDFVEAYNLLGGTLRVKRDLDGAVAAYREALRIKPDYAEAYNDLSYALSDKGDHDGAVAACREAIRLKPGDANPHDSLGDILDAKGDRDGAIAEYREAIRLDPNFAPSQYKLVSALSAKGDHDGAVAASREAIRLKPDFADAHNNLGLALGAKGDRDGAITSYREAIRLKPENAVLHSNLGHALNAKGDHDGAIAELHEAIRLKPDYVYAHKYLGDALDAKGDHDGAITSFREAIRLKPDNAVAHNNLGYALNAKGDRDGAIAMYREAIRLKPGDVIVHSNLGDALSAKGDDDGAIAACREAIRLKPGDVYAWVSLAYTLAAKGDDDGAIAACREAIRLKPGDVYAHDELAYTLYAKGDYDAAIAASREAIRLKPVDAYVHSHLGRALNAKEDHDGAIAAYREAIRLKPDYGWSYFYLGQLQVSQGHFVDALSNLERSHEIGSKSVDWKAPSAERVRECRRFIELEPRLPAILRDEDKPKDAEERLALAKLCGIKKLLAASVRFFEEAIVDRPGLGDDLRDDRFTGERYNAACIAARAGSGRGKDDPPLGETARARLREKALGWLRADLTAWGKLLEGGAQLDRSRTARMLALWKRDPDLAGIRDEAELAGLPEGEREPFRALWADVEALRKKAVATPAGTK